MNPNMNIPAQDPELVIPEGISLEPVDTATILAEEQERANELHIKQRSRLWFALAALLGLALFGVISTIIMKSEPAEKQSYQQFEATSIPLEEVSESSRASLGQISQAEINGTVTINGALS